jgi:hypothetical protein
LSPGNTLNSVSGLVPNRRRYGPLEFINVENWFGRLQSPTVYAMLTLTIRSSDLSAIRASRRVRSSWPVWVGGRSSVQKGIIGRFWCTWLCADIASRTLFFCRHAISCGGFPPPSWSAVLTDQQRTVIAVRRLSNGRRGIWRVTATRASLPRRPNALHIRPHSTMPSTPAMIPTGARRSAGHNPCCRISEKRQSLGPDSGMQQVRLSVPRSLRSVAARVLE